MSSKRALRRRRAEEKEAARKKRMSPAVIFMLVFAVLFGIIMVGAYVFGDSSAPSDPPWPGAVWSPSHGHWH